MPHSAPLQFSILGDSISTFEGYTAPFDAYYYRAHSQWTQMPSVEDTWWWQVIRACGGELLCNDSYSGSSITRGLYQPANAPWRLARLGRDGQRPDRVLIYTGLNDVASHIAPEQFGENYREMLHHLKDLYPAAQVWCGTLCRGVPRNPGIPPFVEFDKLTPLQDYNEAIRAAAAMEDCCLADLAAADSGYQSMDGVHPDGAGMQQLAALWCACMGV